MVIIELCIGCVSDGAEAKCSRAKLKQVPSELLKLNSTLRELTTIQKIHCSFGAAKVGKQLDKVGVHWSCTSGVYGLAIHCSHVLALNACPKLPCNTGKEADTFIP